MINPFKRKIRLVTHDGKFHADDVFSTAFLKIYFEQIDQRGIKVFRTRDPQKMETGDIVYDIGGKYSLKEGIFDHHQIDGGGKRPNDVPYSAFGLIWKDYGLKLVSNPEIHQKIDELFVQQICAGDTGFNDFVIEGLNWKVWSVNEFVQIFQVGLENDPKKLDKEFTKVVLIAREILEKTILKYENQYTDAKKVLDIYEKTNDKRVLVFDQQYAWKEVLTLKPEPLFVISENPINHNFYVTAVPITKNSFEVRKSFPKEWLGKRDEKLKEITGIKDAVFVHSAGFLAVTESLESAIDMAHQSLRREN